MNWPNLPKPIIPIDNGRDRNTANFCCRIVSSSVERRCSSFLRRSSSPLFVFILLLLLVSSSDELSNSRVLHLLAELLFCCSDGTTALGLLLHVMELRLWLPPTCCQDDGGDQAADCFAAMPMITTKEKDANDLMVALRFPFPIFASKKSQKILFHVELTLMTHSFIITITSAVSLHAPA